MPFSADHSRAHFLYSLCQSSTDQVLLVPYAALLVCGRVLPPIFVSALHYAFPSRFKSYGTHAVLRVDSTFQRYSRDLFTGRQTAELIADPFVGEQLTQLPNPSRRR